jgi:protein SCO1/2
MARLGFVLLMTVGCRSAQKPAAGPEQHPIRGKIVSVDVPGQTLTLDHEAVPGLMEAMTMEYRVQDPAVLGEVHPGDRITATLLADRDAAGIRNLRLVDVVVIAQARPDYKPAVVYHVPEPGEEVPDFKLLNEDGKTISMKQFRGEVVAMTFIYTRCPLADYCPRMSRNFAEIDQALKAEPAVYAKTHLLSVSFDPAYDTPKVLKSYGGGMTGKFTSEKFGHWDFAAPQGPELLAMEKWFAVGVTPGENGTLAHSLATTVIGRDGKVIAFYPTKDWDVKQVLGQMEAAAK